MLVMTRKKDEAIVIDDDIIVSVVEIRGDKVRLGIEAPREMPVHRREVYEAIHDWRDPDAMLERSRPASTTIILSGRHVALVDELREAIRQNGGIAPCREQTVEVILEATAERKHQLSDATSLEHLKSLITASNRDAKACDQSR